MGNHLLPHRHRKAQQRRALCLAQRRPAAHDRRSSRQPPRRTLAVELATNKRQGLSHVQGMDAYDYGDYGANATGIRRGQGSPPRWGRSLAAECGPNRALMARSHWSRIPAAQAAGRILRRSFNSR
jgi:hypothetical protein